MLTIRPNQKAVDFIRAKAAVNPDDFGRLPKELRVKAFTTSAAEDLTMLRKILDSLADLPAGADWNAKRREVAAMLGGGKEADAGTRKALRARAKLIVQTAGRQAYAAARYDEMKSQTDVFPYWRYVADGDDRTRPTHMALDGKILRADDPFWDSHYPPWEFGCRCTVVPVTEAEALEAGVTDGKRIPNAPPQEGYRFSPADLNQDPDEMAANYGEEWPDFCNTLRSIPVSARSAGIGESVLDPGGATAQNMTAWSWFYQEFSRKDGLDTAGWIERNKEKIIIRRSDTGEKILSRVGGKRSVSVPDEAFRLANEGVRLSFEHCHPGGTVFPSPHDLDISGRLGFGLMGLNTRDHHITYQLADRAPEFLREIRAFTHGSWTAAKQKGWTEFLKSSVQSGKINVTWEKTKHETV